MMNKLKLWISQWAFRHLYKLVLPEEILRPDGTGRIYFRGKTLEKEEMSDLGEQARLIMKQPVFRMLMLEMTDVANRKIFHESKDTTDILAGKMALYTVDVLEKKLYNISKFR